MFPSHDRGVKAANKQIATGDNKQQHYTFEISHRLKHMHSKLDNTKPAKYITSETINDIQRRAGIEATKIDAFTRAYITAMLWSTTDETDESGGVPMDQNYTIDDIAPESLRGIAQDCDKFQKLAKPLLVAAYKRPGYHGNDGSSPEEMAGHDFWLTRVGHGAGFWDRDALKQGNLGD